MYVTSNDLYYRDYAYLKKMGDCYKLVKCNEVRRSGYQQAGIRRETEGCWIGGIRVRDELLGDYSIGGHFVSRTNTSLNMSVSINENCNARVHTNEEKLRNNITRARNKIIEYGLCNDFDYFCTFTLDKKKYDRHNLPDFISHLGIFIQNINARSDADIKYVLIPEQHKDGAWHLHGFMKGIPKRMLKLFNRKGKEKLPPFIVQGLKSGRQLYDFPKYRESFGFCCLEPINSKIGATMYMCKYMSKEISSNVRELGAHLYYCSKGLKKAEVIAQGQWLDGDFNFDYIHKFGSISFYDSLDQEALDYIKDRIGSDPVTLGDIQRGYKKDKDGFMYYFDPDTGEIFGEEGLKDVESIDWSMPINGKLLQDNQECAVSGKKIEPGEAATKQALPVVAASPDEFRQLKMILYNELEVCYV